MISDYFALAFQSLRKRPLRSALTIIGIVIAIATLFVLVSVSLGLQAAVEEQFRLLGTDKIFVHPRGQLAGPGTESAAQLTLRDVNVIDKVTGVKDLSYVVVGNAKVEFRGETRYAQAIGIPTDRSDVFIESGAFRLDEGRFLKKGDRGFVGLGSQYATTLFSSEINTGSTVTINGRDFKVKVIMQSRGNPGDDRLVLMPLEDFRELFSSGERVDQIMVRAASASEIKEVAERIEKRLRTTRGVTEETQDFTVLTPEEVLATFGNVLSTITAFLGIVAAISLLVGAIGIATTMYTSVLERTRDIGVMKAVGAHNRDILVLFVVESGFLGLAGGLIGVLLGIGIAEAIEYVAVQQLGTTLLQVALPSWLIASCLVFSFLIGALSGIAPAWRASRLKAVDALRYE